MEDFTYEIYNEIVQNVISQGSNKIEAKNALSSILEKYDIKPFENDPNRYDLKFNVKKYLVDKERQGLAQSTLESYKMHLRIFSAFIDKKIQDITKQDVYDYIDHRHTSKNLQNTTLETIRAVLRSFFEWLKDEDLIKDNPMMKMKPFKCKQSVVKYLSIEDLELVRENCEDSRSKALLEIMYSTGLRLSEFASLNIDDIDWVNRSITVLGKGNKERIVLFSPKASYCLKKYLASRNDDCVALFVTIRKKYRRLSNRGIQRIVTEIGKKSGIYIYCHILRHTISTNLLSSGVDLSTVSELLGHSNLNTTKIYAKATPLHKQQCYNKFFNQ